MELLLHKTGRIIDIYELYKMSRSQLLNIVFIFILTQELFSAGWLVMERKEIFIQGEKKREGGGQVKFP